MLRFASEEQQRRWLPGLIDGSVIGALAMTEPESGSDAFAMRTAAERVEDGWRLHGSKTYITNAPVAQLVVCFARTGAGTLGGVSAFLVDADTAGVKRGSAMPAHGLRSAPMGSWPSRTCSCQGLASSAGRPRVGDLQRGDGMGAVLRHRHLRGHAGAAAG